MSNQQYDNTNRGAFWPCGKTPVSGRVNFNGSDYNGTLVRVNQKGNENNLPQFKLFLEKVGSCTAIALWENDPDAPSMASGKHENHFVDVYKSSGEVLAKRGPVLTVRFKPMQNTNQQSASSSNISPSDIIPDEDIQF